MTVRRTLEQAVRQLRVVVLEYEEPGATGPRVCHPHIIYESSAGNLNVHVWQVTGASRSRGLPAWRPLTLSKIRRCELTEECFEIAPGYNPSNRNVYSRIIVKA